MAFVARRNVEGKLVDCQVISGLGNSSMPMSDMSDEDTDSGTVQGYSTRSLMSNTVRYVASKDEDNDNDSCLTYDANNGADHLDNDLDSVASFSDHFEEETVLCSTQKSSYMPKRIEAGRDDVVARRDPDSYVRNFDALQSNDLDSIDGDTVCSPRDEDDRAQPDTLSLDSFDVPLACQSSLPAKMLPEDARSLSSIDSASVSHSNFGMTVIPEDGLSLDLDDCSIVSRLTDMGNSADSQMDTQSQLTSRTFNVKSSTMRRDDCSSASTCSWTDMYGGALKPSESRSNIVPSLSLNLSTTSSSGSSTYFRNLDEEKERHGQEAYQEWVKRKERQKQQKQQAAKQEREKRDAETAMRQRLAKERYQEWCRLKELQQKKTTTGSIKSSGCYSNFSSSSSHSGLSAPKPQPMRKETPEATKKRVEEWDRVKTQQQQRERVRQRQQQLSKDQQEKQRKQKSAGAWQNWMKSVEKRPKPVPLNQGFDTLRGTISNIYVNPIQWVSNIDPNDSRGN